VDPQTLYYPTESTQNGNLSVACYIIDPSSVMDAYQFVYTDPAGDSILYYQESPFAVNYDLSGMPGRLQAEGHWAMGALGV
jgi:hypothetical protein